MVFSYYISATGRVIFPTGSELAAVMIMLMTFGKICHHSKGNDSGNSVSARRAAFPNANVKGTFYPTAIESPRCSDSCPREKMTEVAQL
jgi:hypothetical protein